MKLWIVSVLFLMNGVYAQNYQWVKTMGGTSTEQGTGISVDPSGNVITVGQFFGSVDFDPGAGTTLLTSAGSEDFFIQKLDVNGNLLWVRSIGGTSSDYADAVATDAFGNIFVTGTFFETVDFDPGAGVNNVTAQGSNDGYVLKLDSNGNFVWVRTFEGSNAYSEGTSIHIDAAGSIYTAGYFEGIVDFDPSAATYNLPSLGGSDIFIQKMDSNGNFLWARAFGESNNEEGKMNLDAAGNVLITGFYSGTVDFDPGVGVMNLSAVSNLDAFLLKLDTNGNFVWVKGFGGSGYEEGRSLAVDGLGNMYVTGYFSGTTDFDPGAGVFNLTSSGQGDIFVVKLDVNGDFLWAKNVGGTSDDQASSLELDDLENVYVSGTFRATVDFDPGVNVANATSLGNDDCFILKLDANGNYVWSAKAGGTSFDYCRDIALGSDALYATGTYQNTVDFDPGMGTANTTSVAGYDAYIWKLSQCVPTTGTDVQTACGSYDWIDGNTYTTSNSTATYTLMNAFGCDSIITLNLTLTSIDISVTDNSPVLSSNAAGATYQWIDCNNGNAAIPGATNQSYTALVNGNYAVVVTLNNCSDTSSCFLVDNVGLNDAEKDALLIYPNPTEGVFYIDFTGELNEVSVIDLSGRPVRVHIDVNSGRVDASGLSPGKYMIHVITSDHRTVLKSINIL